MPDKSKFTCYADGGNKYLKITQGSWSRNSVHSFIVKQDCVAKGLNLKAGDILKVASWKTPAINFIRGNIFDKASYQNRVRWTGAS